MKKTLIVIVGATGIGKTDLSIEIAEYFNTFILSSDSRQFYKELKIGTAPPTEKQLKKIKHFFIGNKSIENYYNASSFEVEVLSILEKIFLEKNFAIMVGGSGMYVDAVCNGIDDLPTVDINIRKKLIDKLENEGIESLRFDLQRMDPKHYEVVDLKNAKRILKALEISIMTNKPYSSFLKKKVKKRNFKIIKIALKMDRGKLYERINKRVDIMIENGLIEEVKKFYNKKHLNALNTVGYKEFFAHWDGEYSLEKAIELVKRNSRRLAKRQITWFKRDKNINWFYNNEKEKIINFIKKN
ncbi:MAG: tRNA (adenosine(37)-N6)-dimethylallyltransferase MiaA [Bacteroidetes bacterium 4572_128]|nr:MAG: tRNA (adenosine(37)-N6)-dimethylallyltransferase MiaA [Bacteroidetes bacterium 4572_128]